MFEYMTQNLYQQIKDRDKYFPRAACGVDISICSPSRICTSMGTSTDLKPENLLITNGIVKLADFGLAGRSDRSPRTRITSPRGGTAPRGAAQVALPTAHRHFSPSCHRRRAVPSAAVPRQQRTG